MNRQYVQVGNAVPVQLGTVIGQTLLQVNANALDHDGSVEQLEGAIEVAAKRLRTSARNKRKKNDRQHMLF